jgi:cytochrome c-type biogenesis protein CcmE
MTGRSRGVKKKLIVPSDLRAEAQRLIRTGQMPTLDQFLEAVAKAREKYRPQIIAARLKPKRRHTRG